MTPIRHPHTGALFLVMSNGLTATVDAAAKYMSPSLHAVQVVWGYSLAITVLVLGYAAIRPDSCRRAFATRRPWLQLGRGAMLFVTISMLFMALANMPLADVIAISFAAPLFITLLAAPLLAERVGVHRIGAVVVGLAGVAIVMRPGAGVFEWAALLAFASALFFALFQLTTRVLAATEPPFTTLLYTGIGALVCSSLAVPFFWTPVSAFEIVVFAVIGGLGVGAHVCMIRAYEFTQASFLAPFNYAKLLWAVALGYVVFGDAPHLHVLAGKRGHRRERALRAVPGARAVLSAVPGTPLGTSRRYGSEATTWTALHRMRSNAAEHRAAAVAAWTRSASITPCGWRGVLG